MAGQGYSCGACKFLRRKCTSECVFVPYFSYDQASIHFCAVHKIFGASNVSKMLLHLPLECRNDAAATLSYEAMVRMRDPVYGCVGYIFTLQQQITSLQEEIEMLKSQMETNHMSMLPGSMSMINPGIKFGFDLENDYINHFYNYQDYQQATTTNNNHINEESFPLNGWEDEHSSILDSYINSLLNSNTIEEKSQDIISHDIPWMGNSQIFTNFDGPIW